MKYIVTVLLLLVPLFSAAGDQLDILKNLDPASVQLVSETDKAEIKGEFIERNVYKPRWVAYNCKPPHGSCQYRYEHVIVLSYTEIVYDWEGQLSYTRSY